MTATVHSLDAHREILWCPRCARHVSDGTLGHVVAVLNGFRIIGCPWMGKEEFLMYDEKMLRHTMLAMAENLEVTGG